MGIAGYYNFLCSHYPQVIGRLQLDRRTAASSATVPAENRAAASSATVPAENRAAASSATADGGAPSTTGPPSTARPASSDVPPLLEVPDRYDHLYFDVNNFLYSSSRSRKVSAESLTKRLFSLLHSVMRTLPPTRTIYFAMDGPGPIAKFVLQRQRRALKELKRDETEFDTLQFTPGSEFMQQIKESLIYMSLQRLSRSRGIQYHISGADRYGEGELKIFEHIATTPKSDRCLVVGNDADLILFSLRAGHEQVDVLNVVNEKEAELLSATKLKSALLKSCPDMDERQLATDLAFISILAGNDYLPKVRGFRLDKVWDAYLTARANHLFSPTVPLFDGTTRAINIDFLIHILTPCLSSHVRETQQIEKNAKSALNIMLQKYFDDDEIIRERDVETDKVTERWTVAGTVLGEAQERSVNAARKLLAERALGISAGVLKPDESTLYRLIASKDPSIDMESYVSLVKQYLPSENDNTDNSTTLRPDVGLVWVMSYLEGSCHDYSYRYIHDFAPSVAAIRQFASQAPKSFTFNSSTRPLPPLTFFLALLPPNSEEAVKLVPESYRSLIANADSPLADLYHGPTAEEQWRKNPEKCFVRLQEAINTIPAEHPLLRFQPTLMFENRSEQTMENAPTRPKPFLVKSRPFSKFTPLKQSDIERVACHMERPILSTTTTATSSTTVTSFPRPSPLPLAFRREYSEEPFIERRSQFGWSFKWQNKAGKNSASVHSSQARKVLFSGQCVDSSVISPRSLIHSQRNHMFGISRFGPAALTVRGPLASMYRIKPFL